MLGACATRPDCCLLLCRRVPVLHAPPSHAACAPHDGHIVLGHSGWPESSSRGLSGRPEYLKTSLRAIHGASTRTRGQSTVACAPCHPGAPRQKIQARQRVGASPVVLCLDCGMVQGPCNGLLDLTAVCSSVAAFLFCTHRLRTLPARRMIVTWL